MTGIKDGAPPLKHGLTAAEAAASLHEDRTETIPLVEETVSVGKRVVSGGRVRVSTLTETVEEMARATLTDERVEVTRVPIGREIDRAPEIRSEGDVTIVPVIEEVLVVEKRLVLKEEIHIRRQVVEEAFEEPVQVRRQRAVVERLDASGQPEADPLED